MKGDFVQTSINAQTLARQPRRLRQAGGGDARRRAGPPRRHRHHRARPRKRGFLLGVRRPEGGVHRRVRHADVQSADRHRQGAQGLPGHPAPAADGHGGGHRLRRDQVHRSVHQGSANDADRGRADRDRGDLPVPGQPALDHHSRRHHSAVADRRDVRSAGARLFDQSADAAGAGAGHRPGGRRRHRGGGEHPPAYRGGHAAVRCGHHRRARNRGAGDLDDDHAGGGLCADRVRGRPDRRAVSRVRVHAGGRRHRLGRHCADAVADDGLQAAEGGAQQRPFRPHSRSRVRQPAAALRAAAASHARSAPGHDHGAGGGHGGDRHHVHDLAKRAGAGGGPGHPVQHREDAAAGQPRLSGAGDGAARQGVRNRAGEGARLHHQRPDRRAPGVLGHSVQAVGGARAHAEADPGEPAGQGRRHCQCAGVHVPAAVAAGLAGRRAGAVRDHDHGRLSPARAGAGYPQDRGAEERHVHLHRRRPAGSRRRRSR